MSFFRVISTLLCAGFALGSMAAASPKIHVIDTGGALCTLTEAPGGWMIYDAGVGLTLGNDDLCAQAIDELMPAGETIDLMVLSLADADHIHSVPALLARRKVKQVVRTGHRRDARVWCSTDYWIKARVDGAIPYSEAEYQRRLDWCDDSGREIGVQYYQPWTPLKRQGFQRSLLSDPNCAP